jgi:hypothetical protein
MLLFLSTIIEEKEKPMIETYFSRTPTLTRFRSGPLGADLDELAKTLHQQGYAQDSIRRYVRGCDHFGQWLFHPSLTVARYMILRLFISTCYR